MPPPEKSQTLQGSPQTSGQILVYLCLAWPTPPVSGLCMSYMGALSGKQVPPELTEDNTPRWHSSA